MKQWGDQCNEAEVHTLRMTPGNYVDKKKSAPTEQLHMPLEDLPLITGQIPRKRLHCRLQNMKSQTYLEDTTFTAPSQKIRSVETDPPESGWNRITARSPSAPISRIQATEP